MWLYDKHLFKTHKKRLIIQRYASRRDTHEYVMYGGVKQPKRF